MIARISTFGCWVLLGAAAAPAQTGPPLGGATDLGRAARAVLAPLAGDGPYAIDLTATDRNDGRVREIRASIETDGDEGVGLRVLSPWVELRLLRTKERLVLLLPKRKIAFVGRGSAPAGDGFRLPEIGPRMMQPLSKVAGGLPLLLMMVGVEPVRSDDAAVRFYRIGRRRGIEGLTARIDAKTDRLTGLRWSRDRFSHRSP